MILLLMRHLGNIILLLLLLLLLLIKLLLLLNLLLKLLKLMSLNHLNRRIMVWIHLVHDWNPLSDAWLLHVGNLWNLALMHHGLLIILRRKLTLKLNRLTANVNHLMHLMHLHLLLLGQLLLLFLLLLWRLALLIDLIAVWLGRLDH